MTIKIPLHNCVLRDAFTSVKTIKCQQNSRHSATTYKLNVTKFMTNMYSNSWVGLATVFFFASLINRVTQANQIVTTIISQKWHPCLQTANGKQTPCTFVYNPKKKKTIAIQSNPEPYIQHSLSFILLYKRALSFGSTVIITLRVYNYMFATQEEILGL